MRHTFIYFFLSSDGPSTDEIEIQAVSVDMTVEDIFQHETQVLKEMQETTAVTSRKKRSRKASNYSTGSDGSSDSENDSSLNITTPRQGSKYSYTYNNVSYVLEFLAWWVLKSKVFAQKWNCCILWIDIAHTACIGF